MPDTCIYLDALCLSIIIIFTSIHPSPLGDSCLLSSKPPTIPFRIVVCMFFDNPSQNSTVIWSCCLIAAQLRVSIHLYLALPPGSPIIKLQHVLKLAPRLLFNFSADRRAFIGKRVLNLGGAYWVFHSTDCNFILAKLVFLKNMKNIKTHTKTTTYS